jgi:hypothetical protein
MTSSLCQEHGASVNLCPTILLRKINLSSKNPVSASPRAARRRVQPRLAGAGIVGRTRQGTARSSHSGVRFDRNVARRPLLVFNADGITGKPEDPCSPNARRAAA